MATITTPVTTSRTPRSANRDCRDSVLARYRTPTPPPTADGLTSRQAGEILRIAARHGRSAWRMRPDGTVVLAILGDRPEPDDPATCLILRRDGTIAQATRARRFRRRGAP